MTASPVSIIDCSNPSNISRFPAYWIDRTVDCPKLRDQWTLGRRGVGRPERRRPLQNQTLPGRALDDNRVVRESWDGNAFLKLSRFHLMDDRQRRARFVDVTVALRDEDYPPVTHVIFLGADNRLKGSGGWGAGARRIGDPDRDLLPWAFRAGLLTTLLEQRTFCE
jgi:hypothetical protein